MSHDDAIPLYRSRPWCAARLSVLLILLSASLTSAQTYILTDLGTEFFPEAVNRNGVVCGRYQDRPGVWKPGWATPQHLPGATTAGSCTGVNDWGWYVGYRDVGGQWKAFFYQEGGVFKTIQSPRLPSWALESGMDAVNHSAEATGFARGLEHSCLLRWKTPFTAPVCIFDTGGFGDAPAETMLNDKGLAAGYYDLNGDPGAAFAHARGALDLTWLHPGNAVGESHIGWLAGNTGDEDATFAQIWFPSGTAKILTPPCAPGDTLAHSFATGINQAVSAVGYAACHAAPYAFRWDHSNANPDGVYVDLATVVTNAAGWDLGIPLDVGYNGHIIGVGDDGVVFRSYLLTPVVNTAAP